MKTENKHNKEQNLIPGNSEKYVINSATYSPKVRKMHKNKTKRSIKI